jgi:hypothetical protein
VGGSARNCFRFVWKGWYWLKRVVSNRAMRVNVRDLSSIDLTYYCVTCREELSKANSSSSSRSRYLKPYLAKFQTSGSRLVEHRRSLEGLDRWLQIQLPALPRGYKTFMQELRQHRLETGRSCCLHAGCSLPSKVELPSVTGMGIRSHLKVRNI